MNELKSEFVKSTLYSECTNPDEWFAELYFIRWRLEEYYKCTTFGDVDQIIYHTKPAASQLQLTVIKGGLIKEDVRF
jgi:CRISPR/Cas system-associated protein Csm6